MARRPALVCSEKFSFSSQHAVRIARQNRGIEHDALPGNRQIGFLVGTTVSSHGKGLKNGE
jgi:hypothetical protein